jgi:hypothetical protein
MNTNITQNISIVCDSETLLKIKEMIHEGFEKLKSFVKVKQSEFKIYYELEEKFDAIALKLEKLELFNYELDYFLLISDEILYIIYQNCKNNSFGHCEFALDLFDFFIEIWNAKIKLIENYTENERERHEKLKITFKKRYHQYRREFYWNIYRYSEDFDENETYKFAKSLG